MLILHKLRQRRRIHRLRAEEALVEIAPFLGEEGELLLGLHAFPQF